MANNEARLPVRRQNCCAWSAWSAAQMQKTQAAPRQPGDSQNSYMLEILMSRFSNINRNIF